MLTEKDVEVIALRVIRKFFAGVFNLKSDIDFLSPKDAYKQLGYPSERALREDIRNGFLRIGIEVGDRRSSESTRPVYIVNMAKARQRIMTPPEQRAN